jgi:hypothetical protein
MTLALGRTSRVTSTGSERSLCLVNDSVIGPLNAGGFSTVFSRIRDSDTHLIGLTDSLEITHIFKAISLSRKLKASGLL